MKKTKTNTFTEQFFHEQRYRSTEAMKTLGEYPITICGAGALGANIAETLARSGYANLKVIDSDRIEERNLSTQPYYRFDVGALKGKILANSLYRALGTEIEVSTKRLTAENVGSLLWQGSLVIDAFDNSHSRQVIKDHCLSHGLACLHTGMTAEYAEVIWNPDYLVPSDVNDDLCDYPLARTLVMLTVALTCEVVTRFILKGEIQNYTLTLRDLSIQSFPPS